jgi:hypothetical protein
MVGALRGIAVVFDKKSSPKAILANNTIMVAVGIAKHIERYSLQEKCAERPAWSAPCRARLASGSRLQRM